MKLTCWTVVFFSFSLFHSRLKLPNLCPWASPQQLSSTRGEQKLSRSLQAPRSWTSSCRVGVAQQYALMSAADALNASVSQWPRVLLVVLCRGNWDGLHHRNVRRVSNWEDPVVPHTCCHLSGSVVNFLLICCFKRFSLSSLLFHSCPLIRVVVKVKPCTLTQKEPSDPSDSSLLLRGELEDVFYSTILVELHQLTLAVLSFHDAKQENRVIHICCFPKLSSGMGW